MFTRRFIYVFEYLFLNICILVVKAFLTCVPICQSSYFISLYRSLSSSSSFLFPFSFSISLFSVVSLSLLSILYILVKLVIGQITALYRMTLLLISSHWGIFQVHLGTLLALGAPLVLWLYNALRDAFHVVQINIDRLFNSQKSCCNASCCKHHWEQFRLECLIQVHTLKTRMQQDLNRQHFCHRTARFTLRATVTSLRSCLWGTSKATLALIKKTQDQRSPTGSTFWPCLRNRCKFLIFGTIYSYAVFWNKLRTLVFPEQNSVNSSNFGSNHHKQKILLI